jgi:hypothetical protein
MLDIAGLIASDLIEWRQHHTDAFDIKLSKKGNIFVQGWASGKLQDAFSINEKVDAK